MSACESSPGTAWNSPRTIFTEAEKCGDGEAFSLYREAFAHAAPKTSAAASAMQRADPMAALMDAGWFRGSGDSRISGFNPVSVRSRKRALADATFVADRTTIIAARERRKQEGPCAEDAQTRKCLLLAATRAAFIPISRACNRDVTICRQNPRRPADLRVIPLAFRVLPFRADRAVCGPHGQKGFGAAEEGGTFPAACRSEPFRQILVGS